MKRTIFLLLIPVAIGLSACDDFTGGVNGGFNGPDAYDVSMSDLARVLSELPLEQGHYNEVYDAVCASSGNGYDEEYTMMDLFDAPGSGVGDSRFTKTTKHYDSPLRDLLLGYYQEQCRTKGGAEDAQAFVNSMIEKNMQIYWPYSEDWDGVTVPVITFDPGFGAESNYGYEIKIGEDGARVVNTILVDEEVARTRPVWVINTNDDSGFTPLDFYIPEEGTKATATDQGGKRQLVMKSFKALRSYDSWFGGASEFFLKIGAVDGFKASNDDELKNYTASVTDFVVVIKRKQINLKIPMDVILLTDFTDQMDKLAFIIVEDDGGTITSWKTSAVVKYNSKSYGFDIEIPYREKDDVVWRGQLSANFFDEKKPVEGRFGDVRISFELR